MTDHTATTDPSGLALRCSCGDWSTLIRSAIAYDANWAHAHHVEVEQLRALTATCTCGTTPMTYEGPEADCPVHGAVRAFNEASAEIASLRTQLAEAEARGYARAVAAWRARCGCRAFDLDHNPHTDAQHRSCGLYETPCGDCDDCISAQIHHHERTKLRPLAEPIVAEALADAIQPKERSSDE